MEEDTCEPWATSKKNFVYDYHLQLNFSCKQHND
jgi:hypothetical protein